jgi:hypothetical protein
VPHDPERQAGYLRQTLNQSRRPLGLLLGAGCPVAVRVDGQPLIPDIAGLTALIREQLAASDMSEEWDALTAQLPPDANVEALLSQIRSLRAVAGPDVVRGLNAQQLDALDTEICKTIAELAGKRLSSNDTPFHKVASWAGSSIRTYPVELFTPNYDLLVEQALEETRVPYFDGFVGAVEPFFDLHAIEEDDLPPRWARLWKLHGSINWSLSSDGTVFRTHTSNAGERHVIYPSHLKYEQSRRMPYLALLDRLRTFLRRPSAVLITCGYSYRDQHLNEVLLDGAEGNPSSMLFGLMHGELAQYEEGVKIGHNAVELNLARYGRGGRGHSQRCLAHSRSIASPFRHDRRSLGAVGSGRSVRGSLSPGRLFQVRRRPCASDGIARPSWRRCQLIRPI